MTFSKKKANAHVVPMYRENGHMVFGLIPGAIAVRAAYEGYLPVIIPRCPLTVPSFIFRAGVPWHE